MTTVQIAKRFGRGGVLLSIRVPLSRLAWAKRQLRGPFSSEAALKQVFQRLRSQLDARRRRVLQELGKRGAEARHWIVQTASNQVGANTSAKLHVVIEKYHSNRGLHVRHNCISCSTCHAFLRTGPSSELDGNGSLLRQVVKPLDCSSVDALSIKPLFCRAVKSLLHEVSSRRPEHNL